MSAEQFLARFTCYEHAHGRYELLRGTGSAGKVSGRPYTASGPITLAAVKEHLTGKGPGVGGIPLLADLTVAWAAIDIDVKNIDHGQLARAVHQRGFPLTVCRSKSGGAHLYVFFQEPQPADEVRERLAAWAAALGHAGAEIFPKQSTRADERDIGNWINLPYYDAAKTLRPAYDDNGRELTLEEFLARATAMAQATVPEAAPLAPSNLLEEGPPCLRQIMNLGGFGEGQRNEGMFNVCVYLRKRYGDAWEAHLAVYNEEMCSPPLSESELRALARSVTRKEYNYRCALPPIKPYCQKKACLGCRYGVGDSEVPTDLQITSLMRYDPGNEIDPVLWAVEVGDRRLIVSTEVLYRPDAFNMECLARLGRVPVTMPPARWKRHLDELARTASVVQLPEDASPTGQLWLHVVSFMTGHTRATVLSEVHQGRPFHQNGEVLFRSSDLFDFLRRRRLAHTETSLWLLLRSKGATKKYHKIKVGEREVGTNLWHVPLPEDTPPPTSLPLPAESLGTETF